jgi:hypothetical protein
MLERTDATLLYALRDGTDEVPDADGIEMPLIAVEAAALLSARDCIAEDARNGRIELKYWIEVHDEHGSVVHSLSFADAVAIVPADGQNPGG